MVKISGINTAISQEKLELFFENTKKSGGGDIKSVDMLPTMQMAIITFQDTAGRLNCTISEKQILMKVPVVGLLSRSWVVGLSFVVRSANPPSAG